MESLHLEDGASLEFCLSGSEDGVTLLVFHVGSPCAAALYPSVASAAAARGVRTVSYSRAGYGTSTRNKGRTVADEVENTAALADHLGASAFLVAGWSGGGPSAFACAALLPERVRSCGVLAGLLTARGIRGGLVGRWLAEHIPGVRAQILPGHGHNSIADPFDEVMGALLEDAR
jgi:pimeloyl-ACP methyl ester carboxylesterase